MKIIITLFILIYKTYCLVPNVSLQYLRNKIDDNPFNNNFIQ